ncbi:peptidoglycan DD-metalloendopeptidase family protein [Candidatus Nomurabacteria bacterium]|jgi:LysM repeat protein|nr:MAG: peptidoglycan DD-metalloendopeptidase family protein [Candidatus Nomurabacteria bacterium]
MIKPLFYKRGASGVVFVLLAIGLLLYPLESYANFFSTALFQKPEKAYAQNVPIAKNSQTLPILRAENTTVAMKSSEIADIIISDDTALVPQAGPSGTVADMSEDITSGQISTYVVRSGDSLSVIADMFNVSINTILWANDLKKGQALQTGDTLIILPVTGLKYTVKKGDTVSSIAKKFSLSSSEEIISYNNLETVTVAVGDVLIIPGAELPAEVPVTPKKTPVKQGGSSSVFVKNQSAGSKIAGYFIKPIPCGLTQNKHDKYAIDMSCGGSGMPVKAAASGTVKFAKTGWNGAFGNLVVIAHANGTQTFYAHLSKISVSIGQEVNQGSIIGNVGSTGRSTGPHLHFEVRGAYNPGFDTSGQLWKK